MSRLMIALFCISAAVLVWLGVSWYLASQLTGRPRPQIDEPLPASLADAEPVRLETTDGQSLGAWFVPGKADRPVVLLLHGNGANRRACVAEAEMLRDEGSSVFLITVWAHGDSTGSTNDFGYKRRQDVIAAVDWLENRLPEKPIVIWGRSLGAAAALFASRDLDTRIAGYVLECPYRDLKTAVWNRLHMRLPFLVDRIAYAGLMIVAPLVLEDINRIAPVAAARELPACIPVLVLAGGADRRALPEEAKAIADVVGERARYVLFEEADHIQLYQSDPARFRKMMREFLAEMRRKE